MAILTSCRWCRTDSRTASRSGLHAPIRQRFRHRLARTDQFGNPWVMRTATLAALSSVANTGFSIYHGLQSQLACILSRFHRNVSYLQPQRLTMRPKRSLPCLVSGSLFNLAQNPYDISKAERANSAL